MNTTRLAPSQFPASKHWILTPYIVDQGRVQGSSTFHLLCVLRQNKVRRGHVDLHQSSARCHFRTTQRTLHTIPSAPATTRSLGPEAATPNAQLRHGRVSGYLAKYIPPAHSLSDAFFRLDCSRLFHVERAPTARRHAQVDICALSIVSEICSSACLSFISRFERERLLFLLASSRPLDCEAVVRVGTLSLVQFVGLTVIAVRLWGELPKRGSREPTEQM